MESGSISRYVLYAIGEVLLVMIGILLALQVNNWNETRKERAEEKEILTEISEALKSDVDNYRGMVKYLDHVDSAYFKILYHVDHDVPYDDTLSYCFRYMTQGRTWNYNRSAFKGLETRGLDIIRDKRIKERVLYTYESWFPSFQASIDNFHANIHEYSRPLIRKHFSMITSSDEQFRHNNVYTPIDFESLRKMPEFRNILITLKHATTFQKERAERAIEGIGGFITEIEEYIDQR